MNSIRNKFLGVVIAGLLSMTVAVGIISIVTTNQILRKDADVILETRCLQEAALINDTLGDIQRSVQIMGNYALSELEDTDSLKKADTYDRYIDKTEEMFETIAANTQGVQAYYLRFDPELVSPTSGFFISRKEEGGGIGFLSANRSFKI